MEYNTQRKKIITKEYGRNIQQMIDYLMSIRENASLAAIGDAAPCATVVGIILCILYYFKSTNQ